MSINKKQNTLISDENTSRKSFKIQKIVFFLYFYIVVGISLFLTITYKGNIYEDIIFTISLVFAAPVVYLISHFAFKYIGKFNITNKVKFKNKTKALIFILLFVITLTIFLVWFCAFCPGKFDYDCKEQLETTLSYARRDWHPFLHTLLFYEIPLFTFGKIEAIVVFQIILFALAISFLVETLFEYCNKYFAGIAYLIIMINPNTCNFCMTPWKDVAFAITLIFTFTLLFRLYFNEQKKHIRFIMFTLLCLSLVLSVFFRQNGVIVAVALLLFCVFSFDRKYWVFTVSSFIVLCLLINGPLAWALGVNRINTPVRREIYGPVVSAIGFVYQHHPEKLDEETIEVVNKMAKDDVWQQWGGPDDVLYMIFGKTLYDKTGQWSDIYVLVDKELRTIPIFVKTIFADLKDSLYAIFRLSNFIYAFDENSCCAISDAEEVDCSDLFTYSNNHDLREVIEKWSNIAKPVFGYLGLISLILMFLFLSRCNLASKKGWIKGLLLLSIILYNFGSVPFIIRHEFRYFYFEFIIIFILIAFVFIKQNSWCRKNNKG